MSELTHLDEHGRASMVDVSGKERTARRALARGAVSLSNETLLKILAGAIPKGDVFQVARIAGVMAAKKTPELIPLCHPLSITDIRIEFFPDTDASTITIETEVRAVDRTGVEMEALTATAAAALTIYDMCKAVQKDISIGPFYLVEKEGGKSGKWKCDK